MRSTNQIEFMVTGTYGMFSDPLMRIGGEKCSYQVPTYEALKGILASVYWKPTIILYIDEVRIMNQIQTEVKGIRPIKYNGGNDLSYYTYLKDCCYKVRAHFEWNMNRPELAGDRNLKKHKAIMDRMIAKGGRRDIFLGTRECQGYVEPCVFEEGKGFYDSLNELSFGLMYHGITYPDEACLESEKGKMTAHFWHPVMRNGIITFPRPEACIPKIIRPMEMKIFESQKNYNGSDEWRWNEDGAFSESMRDI